MARFCSKISSFKFRQLWARGKFFWHWDFWGLNHQFWLSKSFPNHFRPLTNRITWFRFSNSPFTLYLWPALQRHNSLCNKSVVNFRKTKAFDDLINHRYTPCLKLLPWPWPLPTSYPINPTNFRRTRAQGPCWTVAFIKIWRKYGHVIRWSCDMDGHVMCGTIEWILKFTFSFLRFDTLQRAFILAIIIPYSIRKRLVLEI